MFFDLGLFVTAIIAAAVASVTGFGIGSLITPVLSLSVGTKIAVALVSIPHLVATAIRFWMLRGHVDKKVLLGFGLMSAIGGLTGAILHSHFATPALTLIFGGILVFAGFMGATGLSRKLKFHGVGSWIAGGVSGILGGLVGNQGGIRSAALLGIQISKESFVATATAIGLIVDASRMPIYFWNDWDGILSGRKWIILTTLGVIIGTLLGAKLLKKLPERAFRRIVSLLIFILGIFMTYRGIVEG
ncbi:MAG: hypothetical protein COV44_02605 [Deltaproteobacteria bacterium CG11_big_fil_rev_8_21_14_0_20_45_16]|nr:MAG: hypothetical protein COV44_02605 [Deltaproteobacteria bacterium CG11_big_fil_rev_8_21_14_0_20_45_16]